MAAIGKVSAVFTASTSGLTAGVKSASSSFRRLQADTKSLESGMRSLVAINAAQLFGSVAAGASRAASSLAGLGASAVSAISAAVEQATALGEETSKSGVIFGASAAEVRKFAESAASIGLSRQAALQATGSFGNLFTAMGLGSQQAAEYAQTMTALGADLASFNNSTVEDAVQAIGAALRGEAEPIRRFGVLLDDATLKQAALSAGLIESTKGSLSPAIKAQAAYAAILQQTTKAQGDFARTGNSLANLSRVIQAQTSNISTTVGAAFEPLYQSIASAVSQVLQAIRPLVDQIAQGMTAGVGRIAAAIQSLVPAFVQFVGTFDGANIGQAIGDGIVRGARLLAEVGDFLIGAIPSAFSFLTQAGQALASAFSIGSQVASGLAFVARLLSIGVLGVIRGALTPLMFVVEQVAKLASYLPGVGDSALVVAASVQGFRDGLDATIQENVNAGWENFDAMFGESAASFGQKSAGPLTSAIDAAVAAINTSSGVSATAAEAIAAAKAPVDIKQSVEVDVERALRGIDSRSQDGINEMFRLMRGRQDDVQQKQLSVLEQIADNTQGIGDGGDFDVVDLAPAAGG